MRRERRNRGSKWEFNWVKHYGRGQTDQGEVLGDCCHITFASGTLRSKVTLLQSIGWLLTIDQFDSMVVDPVVLREFECQVWKKYVRKVRIFGKDLCRSLLGNQVGYLRPTEKVDLIE